jgi:GNAT superfamily N-acetyltransferase
VTPAQRFMRRLCRVSKRDGFGRSVRGCYVEAFESGSGSVYLSQMYVSPSRAGKGKGSRVLAMLCAFADRTGAVIEGFAQPNHHLSQEAEPRLRAWYARHGFAFPERYWDAHITLRGRKIFLGANMVRKPGKSEDNQ